LHYLHRAQTQVSEVEVVRAGARNLEFTLLMSPSPSGKNIPVPRRFAEPGGG